MKKAFSFFRSMKFGIAILLAIMAFSLAGSLIPQGREASWYDSNYPGTGSLITAAELDNIFSSWYFIALIVLFCANLTLCSIVRFISVRKQFRYNKENKIVYKNPLGFYGSFVVHLSILLTFVFGGLVLGLSVKTDYYVTPGETQLLPDGTQLEVISFSVADDTGRTDYKSVIQVTDPKGAKSPPGEISVNYPLSYKSNKYYQHSYGIAGTVAAVDTSTGGSDTFFLTERSFLSADGKNGIWFETMYPGYIIDEHGHIVPVPNMGGGYPDPVYKVLIADGGDMKSEFILPDTPIQIGNVSFTFGKAEYYPGIRVKYVPPVLPPLLYSAFALMVFGFWLSFFHIPVKDELMNKEETKE